MELPGIQMVTTPSRIPNAPPTADEFVKYSSLLSSGMLQLKELDQRISQLESDLISCKQQKIDLNKSLDEARIIMNPVHRMPTETLGQIFLACVDDPFFETEGWSCPHHNSLDSSQAPWSLAQVSHHWRDVALGFSSLWSYIYMDLGAFGDEIPLTLRYDSLLEQVRRAHLSNLRVAIRISPIDIDTILRISPLLAICLITSYKWESLRLCLADIEGSLTLMRPVKDSLPILRSLSITNACSSVNQSPVIVDIFRGAPKLKTVQLKVVGGCQVLMPPGQIVELHDFNCRAPSLLWDIHTFTNLRSCTLVFPRGWRKAMLLSTAPPTIENTHLKQLNLMGPGLVATVGRFTGMTSLSDLTVAHPTLKNVTPLVRSAGCALERLAVTFDSDPVEDLLDVLKEAKSLRSLSLSRKPFNGITEFNDGDIFLFPIMEQLLLPDDPLLPSLTSMTLDKGLSKCDVSELRARRPSIQIRTSS